MDFVPCNSIILFAPGSSKGLYGRSELLELFVNAVCEYFPARIPSLLPGFQHLLSKPALEIIFPAILKVRLSLSYTNIHTCILVEKLDYLWWHVGGAASGSICEGIAEHCPEIKVMSKNRY